MPRAANNNPVMDVVSPPAGERSVSTDSEVDPLDKLAAEDKAEQQVQAKHEAAKPAKPPKAAKSKQPPQNGVRLAITGTVLIVLGLAAMATFAYLQTAN